MDIIRKSLKAYGIAIAIFVFFTFILALVIKYTAFSENWTFIGLIALFAITTFFLGIMEGKIVGKKGLITGFAASLIFILIILFAVGSVFADSFSIKTFDILYVVPLVSGIIGAVAGTNSNK